MALDQHTRALDGTDSGDKEEINTERSCDSVLAKQGAQVGRDLTATPEESAFCDHHLRNSELAASPT